MTERQEYRQIIEAARQLGRTRPDSAEVDEAVAEIRRRLAQPSPSRRRRRVFAAVAAISAAAAALLVAVLIVNSSRPATAAERLRDAADATHAYKGWVHIRPQQRPASTAPASRRSLLEPTDVIMHINTADGRVAVQFKVLGMRNVLMNVPERQEQLVYNSAMNAVRIDAIGKDVAKGWIKAAADAPLRLADMLAEMKKSGMAEPRVTSTDDNGLTRFELTFPQDGRPVPDRYREIAMAGQTVWVDPESKLIRRMRTHSEGRDLLVETSYGAPEIRDIYDLGVPRDTQAIDARADAKLFADEDTTRPAAREPTTRPDPTVDLDAVAERLRGRIAAGFGDHVALLCQEDFPNGHGTHRSGAMTLYAHQGKAELSNYYLAAPLGPIMGLLGFPPNWPTPSLDDALPMLKPVIPVHATVTDGEHAWGIQSYGAQPRPMVQTIPPAHTPSVAEIIWPRLPSPNKAKGQDGEVIYNITINSTLEAVRDVDRPELLGLHTTTATKFNWNGRDVQQRNEYFYWIDPAREDMPIETMHRFGGLAPEDQNKITTIRQIYEEHTRLPDGKWHPTAWRELEQRPAQAGAEPGLRRRYWLQILPNAKLEAEWFADPRQRFPHLPETRPATGPQTRPRD